MTVYDLSRAQLIQLKAAYYDQQHPEGVRYGLLAAVDDLVSDDTILAEYAGVDFVEEDFQGEEVREPWKIFYNRKTGKQYAAYTIRGTFSGEEDATAELLAAENHVDRADIVTRIERR